VEKKREKGGGKKKGESCDRTPRAPRVFVRLPLPSLHGGGGKKRGSVNRTANSLRDKILDSDEAASFYFRKRGLRGGALTPFLTTSQRRRRKRKEGKKKKEGGEKPSLSTSRENQQLIILKSIYLFRRLGERGGGEKEEGEEKGKRARVALFSFGSFFFSFLALKP